MKSNVGAAKTRVLGMLMALMASTGAANSNDAALCLDMTEKQHWSKAIPPCKAAAERGSILPQFTLGYMYEAGNGVAQDYAQAVRWYSLAAAQGLKAAQHNLGLMYGRGRGVAQDYVRAHMWFNLAAMSGDADSVKARDITERQMTREQIAEAQKMARDCVVKTYTKC